MKIAVCDDSQGDLDEFLKLVKKYESENQRAISVDVFTDGRAFLQKFQEESYDAVFLDIYMGGISGVEVARQIRKTDENVRLIFTTVSTDHLLDGFAVEASHYLLKPLTEEKLGEAMHRIRSVYAAGEAFLILSGGNSKIKIPQNRILYIETIRNGIKIHCRGQCLSVRSALSAAMEQLDEGQFLQCHRYFAVNLEAVKQVEADAFLMNDGQRILIRKDGRREIKDAYHRYIMNRLRGDLP